MTVPVGVSWMPDPRFRAAVEPALSLLEAVEHTVDHRFGAPLPPSADHVFAAFGRHGRLHGHSVNGSVFSADRADRFEAFLSDLARTVGGVALADLSEHYGACTGGPYVAGAPIPVPETAEARDHAIERLARVRDVAGVPVGLENLALAFSRRQALAQGGFVASVLAGVDGFLHLDLHNLWCQVRNFDLAPDVLLATWPLDRVARIHVSGGSDVEGLRRDTHDHRVPEGVWDLLAAVLPRVPGCRAVFLEQLPFALETEDQQAGFRADLQRLREVRDAAGAGALAPPSPPLPELPRLGSVDDLAAFQRATFAALAEHPTGDVVRSALLADPAAAPYRAWVEDLEPRMLRVGHLLVHRWGVRDVAPGVEGG